MKFRVERDVLADAVAWTARSLPPRPAVPVLGGVLLELDEANLSVSGFDYEVSTQADVMVHSSSAGRVLVSGRLLADITKSLPPHPVDVSVDGQRVTISCGGARFTLPTMPVEDYPTLPSMPAVVGTVPSDLFATAVQQVAVAAGREESLPMLTGVRLEIEDDRLVLAATDRYRLACRELSWKPEQSGMTKAVLVPAKTLLDTARALASDGPEVTLALAAGETGEGMIGFAGAGKRTTTRLLDAQFPPYQSLWPKEVTGVAETIAAPLIEALKRVKLMADREAPVVLAFDGDQVRLSAGGDDDGRAEEHLEGAVNTDPVSFKFKPSYLLDGLSVLDGERARLSFTDPTKPVVLSSVNPGEEGEDTKAASDYRYLVMPVRLLG